MSTYKGEGTLFNIVKRKNEQLRIVEAKRINESGEYFRNHTYLDKKEAETRTDIDFKTQKKDINQIEDKIVPKDIEKDIVNNEVDVDKVKKSENERDVNPEGLDFYIKDQSPKSEKQKDKEVKPETNPLKNVKFDGYKK